MKQKLLDGAFVCTVILTIALFNWNDTSIQTFISGGLLGILGTLRFY